MRQEYFKENPVRTMRVILNSRRQEAIHVLEKLPRLHSSLQFRLCVLGTKAGFLLGHIKAKRGSHAPGVNHDRRARCLARGPGPPEAGFLPPLGARKTIDILDTSTVDGQSLGQGASRHVHEARTAMENAAGPRHRLRAFRRKHHFNPKGSSSRGLRNSGPIL